MIYLLNVIFICERNRFQLQSKQCINLPGHSTLPCYNGLAKAGYGFFLCLFLTGQGTGQDTVRKIHPVNISGWYTKITWYFLIIFIEDCQFFFLKTLITIMISYRLMFGVSKCISYINKKRNDQIIMFILFYLFFNRQSNSSCYYI